MDSRRRDAIRGCFFKVTRHRPSFCRRVKEWGLCMTPRSPRVIVSLTSYPKRIGTVHRTIETLLTQTFKPDMVVLWLGYDKFPNKETDLPKSLLRLKDYGLTIGWCKDIRSYTKLVPSLRAYPEDIIVTADDDVFYQTNWLEKLYDSYLLEKDIIHCHLVLRVKVERDGFAPYASWTWISEYVLPRYDNLLMGVSGVLYPPHCLFVDVTDSEKALALAPFADDLWFWSMALLQGTRIGCVEGANGAPEGDFTADFTDALTEINVGQGKNDIQLANIVKAYPVILEKLRETNEF